MPTTELLDTWQANALPLLAAATVTVGMVLVTGSLLVSWVRRAIEAT